MKLYVAIHFIDGQFDYCDSVDPDETPEDYLENFQDDEVTVKFIEVDLPDPAPKAPKAEIKANIIAKVDVT